MQMLLVSWPQWALSSSSIRAPISTKTLTLSLMTFCTTLMLPNWYAFFSILCLLDLWCILLLWFLHFCIYVISAVPNLNMSFRLTMRTSLSTMSSPSLSTMSSPTRRGPTLLLCNSERRKPSLVHLLTKTIVPFSIMYFYKCCFIHCPTVLGPGPLVPYTILCYFFFKCFQIIYNKVKKNDLNLISAISVPFLNLLQASSKFYFMFISLLLSLYHSWILIS